MKTASAIFWLAGVLFSAAATSQGEVAAYHNSGVPIAGLPGFRGYTVFLTSDDPGALQAAFQGSFDGPMNQLQAFGNLDTPTLTLADHLGADIEKDSHFLIYDDQVVIISAGGGTPHETATHLGATFCFFPADHSEPKALAYVVVPDANAVTLSGKATDAAAQEIFLIDLVIPQPRSLTFEAGTESWSTLESGSADQGPDPAALTETFALATLQIGGGDVGRLRLTDRHDNQGDGDQPPEALYVENLILAAGSYLDLGGLNLYYVNLIDQGGTIAYKGGSLVQVPEPAAVSLLALGALLKLRRRRR